MGKIMASLRDSFGVHTDSGRAEQLQEQSIANGMGSVARGWNTGRIGTELNPLRTQELEAQIANDEPRRSALREQIDALEAKQAMYAPKTNSLEDVDTQGYGSIPGYIGAQVGQGAASMLDPMAVSAGLSTVGRAASYLPGPLAKGVGLAAQGAAIGIPYLMSKNQLQGEFIGNAQQDKDLMAKTSPQALRGMAGNYGALAAIPDSALPGLVGRQVSGLSRAEGAVARKAAMGPGLKTLGGMGLEGGTEALQSEGSHQALGILNPNRDTSGDMMGNLNNFAGGALGSSPVSAAGAYSEAGHNRVGAGADAVKGAAGDVVDMANEAYNSPTVQAGIGKAREIFGSGKDKVIDMLGDQDGEVTIDSVKRTAKEAVGKYVRSAEDNQILQGTPPPEGMSPEKAAAWMTKVDAQREEVVNRNLAGLTDDPQAQEFAAKIAAATDPLDKADIVSEAGDFLLQRQDQVGAKAGNTNGNWGIVGGALANAAGRGLAGVVKAGVAGVTEVARGAKAGFTSKKNAQVEQGDPYQQWKERTGFDNAKGSSETADSALTGIEKERSLRRAQMFSDRLVGLARSTKNEDVTDFMRDVGYQIADASDRPVAGQELVANTIGHTLRTLFGGQGLQALTEMTRMSSPEQAPFMQLLIEEFQRSGTQEGRTARAEMRSAAADQLLMMMPKEIYNDVAADPSGKYQMLGMFEKLAAGGISRQARNVLESKFGPKNFRHMLSIVNGVTAAKDSTNESAMTEGVDEFEQAQAQKKMDKGTSHIYAFGGNLNLRTKKDGDPFAKTSKDGKKVSKEADNAAELQGDDSVRRPQLYKKDEMWDGAGQSGENKLDARIAEVKQMIGHKGDDETNGWGVESVPAFEVMKGRDMQPEQILGLYRDYLRMDAQSKTAETGGKLKAAKEATAAQHLVAQLTGRAKLEEKNPNSWTPGEFNSWRDTLSAAVAAGYKGNEEPSGMGAQLDFLRDKAMEKAKAYFSERHIVRAYSMTDNDSQKMGVDQALDLQRRGVKRADKVKLDAYRAGDDQEAADKIISDANIFYFPTEKKVKGETVTIDVPIIGSDLVKWAKTVKDQRGQTEADGDVSHSPAKTNARYFQDLMDGINAYHTDHAAGLPYKFNPAGEKESLTDGVPSSMMLANAPYHEAVKERGFRLTNKSALGLAAQEGNPNKLATQSDANQDLVGEDQAKQAEYFTPDDRADRELEVSPWAVNPRRSGKDDTSTAASSKSARGELVTRGPNNNDINNLSSRGTSTSIRADISGTVEAKAKTSRDDATPLDFTKGQDPKAAADETTAQKYFTDQVNEKYQAPTSALRGMSSAKYVAEGLIKTMLDDKRAGDREAVTMLRTALKPNKAADAVGKTYEAYRVAPLIRLVSDDHEDMGKGQFRPLTQLQYFENAGATPELVNIIRRGAAQVLQRDSNMTDAHKLMLARQLLGQPGTTQVNFVSRLQALINNEGGVVTPEEMRVNWGDPSKLPTSEAPKVQPAPHVAPKQTIHEKVAAKADTSAGLMTDDEIANFTVAKKPSAPVMPVGDNEASRRARNAVDANRAAAAKLKPLSANDQLLANAKTRLAASQSAQGVANAGLPKGRSGVNLGASGPYAAKDQAKSDQATKFIGQGSAASSTAKYAKAWGDRANSGGYTSADRVFVSAEGNRAGRLTPDTAEIDRATRVGATILTDDAANRNRDYNIGERRVAYILKDAGYTESSPGVWTPASKRNAQISQFPDRKKEVFREKVQGIVDGMSDEDMYTLQHDVLDADFKYPKMPTILSEYFNDWKDDYGPGESGLSSDRIHETYREYYQFIVDDPEGWDPEQVTMAQALLDGKVGPAGVKRNAMVQHTSYVDEITVHGKVWDLGPGVAVEATHAEEAYGSKVAVPKGSVYFELFDDSGEQYSGWLKTVDEVVRFAKQKGITVSEPTAKQEEKYHPLNKQADATTAEATPAQMAEAAKWLEKVAPGTILKFIKEAGYSGEFVEAQNLINISTTAAAGIMGTVYHEGLHKFFAQFVQSNPKLQRMFDKFVNDPRILKRLETLLEGYPGALGQLKDGEERLAYAFQFWKAGLLHIDNENRSLLQKISAIFRRVFGMVRDSEHALAIFQAFDEGKLATPSVAGQVIAAQLNKGSTALKIRRGMDGLTQGLAAAALPAEVILGRNEHSAEARKLSAILFTNPGDEAAGGGKVGYLNAKRSEGKAWANKINAVLTTMDQGDIAAVQKHMQAQTALDDIKITAHRNAVASFRETMDEFHTYMRQAGLNIGKVADYYPTVWSVDALHKNKDKFVNMLVNKYAQQMNPEGGNAKASAERIWASLVEREGIDEKALNASRTDLTDADPNASKIANREDGVLSPFFAGKEQRTLWWLDGADKEEFLSKNMGHTITQYFHQGVRAAEYMRRFGENGIRLERSLKTIRTQLTSASNDMLKAGELKDEAARVKWLGRQTRDITMAVGAIEGTLGKDITPNMRKFNSYMIAYQNIRLLPYMIFSSFVDPLAQVARGAPMAAAMETFTYGMREVFRSWADMFRDMPKERVKDEWTKLAEHIGAVEVAMFNHHVADEYSSVYMSPMARKINETLFKMNGMEAWDRANRTMATKWAVRFIEQHQALPDKHHSARWLAELGLKADTIALNADGQLITTAEELSVVKGIGMPQAKAEIAVVHAALNRWVEGAVISPNAAQRPGWSSDPNYAAVFHLKQFSYSFQQTIMKRAVNEMEHGNMRPISALAGFVPTMLAADLMKGLLQGGGSLPPHLAGMDAGDRIMYAVKHSGLTGVGDIGINTAEDWSSLGGPGFEQAVDALRDNADRTLTKAIPLHAMGEHLFSRRLPVGLQ